MIIGKLTIENVKRIKAVEITPDGNLVRITGKNANGKSSILDSISMLFCGKKLIPERPVRDGEETAKIEAESGDYVITRHWTSPDKSYLTLKNKDGAKFSNAQSILDGLVNDLSFDPIHFSLSKPQERVEKLREITGIDLSDIERRHNNAYALRRDFGRDLKKQESYVTSLELQKVSEEDEITLESLEEDLRIHEEEIDKIKAIEDHEKVRNQKITQNESKIDGIEKANERIEQKIRELQSEIDENCAMKELCLSEIENLCLQVKVVPDREAVETEARNAVIKIAEFKAKDRERRMIKQAMSELESITKKYNEQDEILKKLSYEKEQLFKKCKMPIDGLDFGPSDVEFNGMPFSQLSTSEQIRISMSIAIAKNPKLKVIVINNGSLLDEDALREVEAIARKHEFQVWIEEVASSKEEGCVYIQDGEAI